MHYELARRMNELRASEIREMLKVTSRPEVISFAGGLPAPELFPIDGFRAACDEVLRNEGQQALQYSTTEGCPRLREAIAERMNRTRGTSIEADDVLVTAGSQQGLDMTAKLFVDEGDVVLCESPTYIGAISAFRVFGPRFVEVPTDDDGMIIPALERCIANHPEAKFAYVVPDSQNPSGRTWSVERRRRFMEVMTTARIPVIEDGPYSEVHFGDAAMPSLKSMDTADLVVYLGTFSKILSPGLRLAWVVAQRELLQKYVLVKQGTDLHTSTFAQRAVWTYLQRYDIDKHISYIRAMYRQRRDTMLEALDRCMPPGVRYTRPQGGMFIWVGLPEGCDAHELLALCLERDVAFVPGGSFFPNGGHENTLRLNFSAMAPDRIVDGIQRVAEALQEYLAAREALRSA
jgi:DNA-binding transcriptional MocR family regulator